MEGRNGCNDRTGQGRAWPGQGWIGRGARTGQGEGEGEERERRGEDRRGEDRARARAKERERERERAGQWQDRIEKHLLKLPVSIPGVCKEGRRRELRKEVKKEESG
jgi:hypothetical protein